MIAYYNEIDPYCCQWLENLMSAELIPAGVIDSRSIKDVQPEDLEGYDQCHFFAGIAGWSYALQLAEWPADKQVWTGSCPCQPFSAAGKRKGVEDERHLWPEFRRLIESCQPATVFGEQVASKDGRKWLARVRSDLETLGYGVGSADLCAAGVGAPHIRQRLYWMAESAGIRRGGRGLDHGSAEESGRAQEAQRSILRESIAASGVTSWLAQSERHVGEPGWIANESRECVEVPGTRAHAEPRRCGVSGGLADTDGRIEGYRDLQRSGQYGQQPTNSWSSFDVIPCLDGKARRVEAGTFPLAHGVPQRMGKLRAYGNAIVPQVAAEFVSSYLEV